MKGHDCVHVFWRTIMSLFDQWSQSMQWRQTMEQWAANSTLAASLGGEAI
jgi:hypothetical protein